MSGVPGGVINQVQVRREDAAEVTEALIAHPAIRKIEFIGSANIGRSIGQLTSKYLKPILMELGGKGPVIILKDVDLKNAAQNVAFGAFYHHGQLCFSTERIIVLREVADEFLRELKEEANKNYANGAGSAATKGFALHSQAMLQDAKDAGAEFIIGDNTLIGEHKVDLTPTILTNVERTSQLADEEAFGPSASFFIVDGVDTAVNMANDSNYGLTAAVWTRDVMLSLDISARLQYGLVHVNACTLSDLPTTPEQGWKNSGWGSQNASYGINEYLQTKTVTVRPSDAKAQFKGED